MSFTFENNIIFSEDTDINSNIGGIGTLAFKCMMKNSRYDAQLQDDNLDTHGTLLTKSVRTALNLREIGIKKGDIILLCANLHLNACVPILASYFLGAIPVSVHPELSTIECKNIIKQINPKVAFADNDAIKEVLESCGLHINVHLFGKDFTEHFLQKHDEEDVFQPFFVEDLQETACIYFTSGSTGTPKGICISHYYILACLQYLTEHDISKIFELEIISKSKVPLYSNWCWISTGILLIHACVFGRCLILCSSFDPNELWYLIDKFKMTRVSLGSVDFIEFSDSIKPSELDVSSLTTISTYGYPVPMEHILKLKKSLPGVCVVQRYAMTEASHCTLFDTTKELHRKYAEAKPTSMGMPCSGMSYKVVDVDTGENLGPNQSGLLKIKSKRLFNGYYNKDYPDKFDTEGWFNTEDIVHYDEDFCFYFDGRSDDRIEYKDWWFFPASIEAVLMTHPSVKNAVVVGKPHKTDQKHPVALVLLKDNEHAVEAEELERFVAERVNEYQRIRGGVYFLQQFPFTPTGKIKRKKLEQMVLDGTIGKA